MFSNFVSLARIGRIALKRSLPVRGSHGHAQWTYRSLPSPPKASIIQAEILGAFLWWWVLWHFWHDYGHIIGEFPYPDTSKWTDEELGIPPDDED